MSFISPIWIPFLPSVWFSTKVRFPVSVLHEKTVNVFVQLDFYSFICFISIFTNSAFLKGLQMLAVNPYSAGFFIIGSSAYPLANRDF